MEQAKHIQKINYNDELCSLSQPGLCRAIQKQLPNRISNLVKLGKKFCLPQLEKAIVFPPPAGGGQEGVLTTKAAFTLAEVLITLGIIGIVAALTLPAITVKTRKSEATARLKKFYSTMSQAILFAENDNGSRAYEWIDQDDYASEITDNPQRKYDLMFDYWNKYLNPYIKTVKVENGVYIEDEEGSTDNSKPVKVYFADGSTLTMHFGACIDLQFDVNGDRQPNEFGKDKFVFFIATNKSYKKPVEHEIQRNKSFAAAYLPEYNTREKALNACKSARKYCSTLLQYDNWEFKEDYPYKL